METKPIRIGISANEDSGDMLGAKLIRSLRAQTDRPIEVVGMGGALLQQEGCRLLVSIDEAKAFKLESLSSVWNMLSLRRSLKNDFLSWRPDVFIGLDAPDFNLPLAKQLRSSGIRTIQYVGPSVWYWRSGRVRDVAKAVDAILLLFPFERDYYKDVPVQAEVTGHPAVDELEVSTETKTARQKLNLETDKPMLGLMMGSRDRELSLLTEDFLRTAMICQKQLPTLRLLANLQSEKHIAYVTQMHKSLCPDLPLTLLKDRSSDVMRAADALLLCSGTVTLEAMLLARPMVVAYRVQPLVFCILKLLFHRFRPLTCFSLPNIIAGRRLVPEFFQKQVCPSQLSIPLLRLLSDSAEAAVQRDAFIQLRDILPTRAADQAARVVLRQLEAR